MLCILLFFVPETNIESGDVLATDGLTELSYRVYIQHLFGFNFLIQYIIKSKLLNFNKKQINNNYYVLTILVYCQNKGLSLVHQILLYILKIEKTKTKNIELIALETHSFQIHQ